MRLSLRGLVVLLAALALAALTARLGLWQLDRAAQKTALQQARQTQLALPVLTLPELARDTVAAGLQQHRSVILQGRWRGEHTIYLENRQMLGRPGFYAITPLQLDDGSSVLVQRGWLPRDLLDRTRTVAGAVALGRVQVSGRIALTPARLYEFSAAASGPIRQNLEIELFSRETGLPLRPVTVVQQDSPDAATDGLLRQWPLPSAGVEKHHGYAFQWFALSALTVGLYLWFQVLRPRHRKATEPTLPAGPDRS